jgi:hypothetical protein
MVSHIQHFSQNEYNKVLDEHSARIKGLSQAECENILIKHDASYEQAKNGAYVYIHHNGNASASGRRGNQGEYTGILDKFGATQTAPQECIRYLEALGFSYGQSKTAVYHYRCDKGLIRR